MSETDPKFRFWIRRSDGGGLPYALRFEVLDGKGVLRVARPGVIIDPPARVNGYEDSLASNQLRASRFLHVWSSGRKRQGYVLSKLSDTLLADLEPEVWYELAMVKDGGFRYLQLPESGDVIELGSTTSGAAAGVSSIQSIPPSALVPLDEDDEATVLEIGPATGEDDAEPTVVDSSELIGGRPVILAEETSDEFTDLGAPLPMSEETDDELGALYEMEDGDDVTVVDMTEGGASKHVTAALKKAMRAHPTRDHIPAALLSANAGDFELTVDDSNEWTGDADTSDEGLLVMESADDDYRDSAKGATVLELPQPEEVPETPAPAPPPAAVPVPMDLGHGTVLVRGLRRALDQEKLRGLELATHIRKLEARLRDLGELVEPYAVPDGAEFTEGD